MIAIEMLETLQKENLAPVTVLTGEDLGQYVQLKQAFLDKIAFDPSDLAYSYFDMSETDYQDAAIDLESLPFFADQKIVIFDHFFDLTTDKRSYLNEQSLKRFEDYLGNPLDSTKLVICAAGKLDGKRRLVKRLKRDAQILQANPLKEAELKTYFQKRAHQDGLSFASGAFNELMLKSNLDFSEMDKNLIFLKSYKKNGQITSQDIKEAIPKTLQDNIFDLTQLVLSGKIEAAYDLVRDLRLQGEDEIKLIAIMLGQFRLFAQIKILANQNKPEQQIVTDLSHYLGRKVNPYQVKYALRDSRTLSLSYLKQCLIYLIETDYQIKTGVYDKDYLFDLVILKMAGAKK
ncbi:DNA polymerase III subunit delta [Streptococcus macacae]|uniref:DNA polymerase III subunit delta n=1 Tax=Streptococcus macacae NCTC 11558 TaxID=764298 RepID=G5JUV4_9STRE|nr:DNA polymerase III subunit delta [Streptococcus macacae]EHJ51558.1 DNA polymerase III, delta subunit [Streptococcus macacae NCTC 11558]SUN78919.1 DNA polymerase III subunit delta [Streptococcus macacae NCTC 11558]